MCGRRSRKKEFPFGIVMISLLVVFAMIGVGVGYWFLVRSDTRTVDSELIVDGGAISVEIPTGTSVAGIAEILDDAGVISGTTVFRVQVRLADADETLLAGTYNMYAGMSYADIITLLQTGPPRRDVVTVTIPEGRSIDRMALILEEDLSFSAAEFIEIAQNSAPEFALEFPFLVGAFDDSLEGYLFPDTYEFFEEASAHEVITLMLRRFESVWNGLDNPTGPAASMTPAELVVIASLVEMESSLERERPLVSSVIYNRLAINRKLQFCSTVQFLIPGEERQRLRLTYAQTQVPSPYNTYMNVGLPPGPISNPGRQALSAALHPADTDYIYFVLTGTDGSQTFASNSADFNRARQKSREVFGQ